MPLKKARLKISDYNKNRKARLNKQERRVAMVSLSLTSMVDMFAILVIFLLTNATTVAQWIEVGHNIELPKAKFSDPPPKAATVQISKDGIYAENKLLVALAQVPKGDASMTIAQVKAYLAKQPKPGKADAYVNIVAHTTVPFGVIRRVIATCQEAGFANVNLAVQPKS